MRMSAKYTCKEFCLFVYIINKLHAYNIDKK